MSTTLWFHGGARSVTGANFLLAGERTRLLVDCGLVQGSRFAESENREPFPYDPAAVDCLLVTHAHLDHIGRIPKLVRDGFCGEIVSTPETRALAALMLPDALRVMRDERVPGEEPCYGEEDVERAFLLWKTAAYRAPRAVGEFEARLLDAGHILGSAMCEITRAADARSGEQAPIGAHEGPNGRRGIIFTGDLGNSPSPLLRDTDAVTDAAYLVMESVYGDRNHEEGEERRQRLTRFIRDAIARGGALLIPSFSLEKTQVLLHEMNDLIDAGAVPSVPVFLDSPLAIRVTEVYRRMHEHLNDEAKAHLASGDDLFDFPRLKLTMRAADSNDIARAPSPKIIIAGSGMSGGGRILSHEKAHLGDPRSTILFAGYQAAGSLGRQIQEGVQRVEIDGAEITVRARVETITGYSSHRDSEGLLEFVAQAAEKGALERVFVTMGEPKSSLFLAQRVRDYLGIEAQVPQLGESAEILL